MDEYLVIALLVNTALSFIVSHVAFLRGKSPGAFFALSFLASFLVGILVLIALTGSDNSSDNSSDKDRMNCPFCDEAISPNAKICQFCKSNVVAHFEEVTQRDVAVQAQAAKDEAEKSAALELEEREANKLSEQRRLQEAQSRKLLVAKLLRSPIAWIITVLLVGGSVGTFLLVTQESRQETERVQALMDFDCTISQDAIQINFEPDLDINVQLPPECHVGIRTALEQNVYPSEFGGDISIRVFLDDELVSDRLKAYIPAKTNYSYSTRILDQSFREYRIEFGTAAAKLRVEAEFLGGNLRSDLTSLTVDVLDPKKDQRFFDIGAYDLSSSSLGWTDLSSRYVVDEFFFDWPGTQFDEIIDTESYGDGPYGRDYSSDGPGGAGKLTVTAYIDGVEVQTESTDY